MKKVFDRKFLVDELGLPYDNDEIIMEDEVVDTLRWSIVHSLIFKHDGKYYKTYYSVGATEMQYESPWEYEESVECTEVELKEVLVKKWVEVQSVTVEDCTQ